MPSIFRPLDVIRFCLVGILAMCLAACDSDGDTRQLINLVSVAEQGYTRIAINGGSGTVIETGASTQLSVQAFTDDSESVVTIDADIVVWRSTDRRIAEVDPKDGTVFGRDTDGTAQITATFGNLVATTEVRVSSAPLVSIIIQPSGASMLLNECSATQFEARGVYEGEAEQRVISDAINWSVPQTSASISDSGLLRVTAAGEVSVVAIRPESVDRQQVIQTETFTVDSNLEGINIVPEAGELAIDAPLQYGAFAVYANIDDTTIDITDNVEWSISGLAESGDFAGVVNGLVTAERAGDGVLTATCDGTQISQSMNIHAAGSGVYAGFEVTPFNAARSVPLLVQFEGVEDTTELVATALFQDDQGGDNVTNDAEWTITSGSTTIFSIGNDEDEDKGVLTIRGTGSVTVTATYTDDDDNTWSNSIIVNSSLP